MRLALRGIPLHKRYVFSLAHIYILDVNVPGDIKYGKSKGILIVYVMLYIYYLIRSVYE